MKTLYLARIFKRPEIFTETTDSFKYLKFYWDRNNCANLLSTMVIAHNMRRFFQQQANEANQLLLKGKGASPDLTEKKEESKEKGNHNHSLADLGKDEKCIDVSIHCVWKRCDRSCTFYILKVDSSSQCRLFSNSVAA